MVRSYIYDGATLINPFREGTTDAEAPTGYTKRWRPCVQGFGSGCKLQQSRVLQITEIGSVSSRLLGVSIHG